MTAERSPSSYPEHCVSEALGFITCLIGFPQTEGLPRSSVEVPIPKRIVVVLEDTQDAKPGPLAGPSLPSSSAGLSGPGSQCPSLHDIRD